MRASGRVSGKQDQIRYMDVIYSNAVFIICATFGDAFSGPPGVNGTDRQPDAIEVVGGQKLGVCQVHVERILSDSRCVTPAWTFQEMV